MGESYLTAILRFALRRAFTLTDRLSVIAGVLMPAIWHVTGKPMPEWLAAYVAWAIVIAVGGGVGLRFITAPYFIWREQNATIALLRLELAKPEEAMRKVIHNDIAAARIALFEQLSRIHERFGKKTFNKDQYYENLSGEQTGILAAKILHDFEFAKSWEEHLGIAERLHKFGTDIPWMQNNNRRELEESHFNLLRIIQLNK